MGPLPPPVAEVSGEIARLCRRFGVRRLELFGSAASTGFDPATSDLDFFVEFLDRDYHGAFGRYIGLKLALEDLFGRPVDLVEPEAVENPLFTRLARRHVRVVYAA